VVVHGGEELVIRKLVLAGILSAEKSYLDCLSVIKEVSTSVVHINGVVWLEVMFGWLGMCGSSQRKVGQQSNCSNHSLLVQYVNKLNSCVSTNDLVHSVEHVQVELADEGW
jgi:hypothetical protein